MKYNIFLSKEKEKKNPLESASMPKKLEKQTVLTLLHSEWPKLCGRSGCNRVNEAVHDLYVDRTLISIQQDCSV